MRQRGGEGLEVLGRLRLGLDGADRAHQHHDLAGGGVVLLDQQRVDQFAQQPAGARVDAAHDAEVQEHDSALVVDEQVAGVQVAVEQAVPQAALEGREQQRLDQLGAVESLLADRRRRRRCAPRDTRSMVSTRSLVNSQCTCGTRMLRPSGEPCRPDTQASIDCASMRKSSSSARLSAKSATTSCADSRRPSLASSTDLREALEDLQVGGDPAADARPLDLDDDLLAGVQGGEVHLGDRRRGERLLLERGEQVGRVGAEFLLEQLVHLARCRPAARRRAGCGTRGTVCSPNAPGARGDDLAELDVGGAQVGEGLRNLPDDLVLAACPWPGSLVRTRAPVRVSCQPVTPMRAASTGSGTRSSLATSRCVFGRTHSCQCAKSAQVSPNFPPPGLRPAGRFAGVHVTSAESTELFVGEPDAPLQLVRVRYRVTLRRSGSTATGCSVGGVPAGR